jgi:hypothetical protein
MAAGPVLDRAASPADAAGLIPRPPARPPHQDQQAEHD